MICPSVSNCAIPLPATIRMSVATIGWTPIQATSAPFHAPRTRQMPQVTARAAGRAVWCCTINFAATEPAIATMAPTDRSTPAVAITRVMPRETSMTRDDSFAMSTRLP